MVTHPSLDQREPPGLRALLSGGIARLHFSQGSRLLWAVRGAEAHRPPALAVLSLLLPSLCFKKSAVEGTPEAVAPGWSPEFSKRVPHPHTQFLPSVSFLNRNKSVQTIAEGSLGQVTREVGDAVCHFTEPAALQLFQGTPHPEDSRGEGKETMVGSCWPQAQPCSAPARQGGNSTPGRSTLCCHTRGRPSPSTGRVSLQWQGGVPPTETLDGDSTARWCSATLCVPAFPGQAT